MAWVYDVNRNAFYLNREFRFFAEYTGANGYKNNTDFECIKNKGPLPRGKYKIVGKPFTHPVAGRFTLRLEPYQGNRMCGRGGFLIHGDNGKGTASEGCIVAGPYKRQTIWDSMDKELIVK